MHLLIRLAAPMILAAAPAIAQDTPPDLRDMIGARAGQGEGELARRGYRFVRGEKGDDRSYSYWWQADRRRCVTVATMNGRYDSIVAAPAPDCRQPAVSDRGPPPRDHRPGASGTVSGNLPRTCKGEAAAAFDRRPNEITTNAPIRLRGSIIVQGWYDQRSGTKFFNCRFDAEGRFVSVN